MAEEKTEKNLEKSSGRAADAVGAASKEASAGMPALVEKRREEQAYQKSENRPPGDISRLLGKSPALLEALKVAQGEKPEPKARESGAHQGTEKQSETDRKILTHANSDQDSAHKPSAEKAGYSGEQISRDVEPATHIVQSTDNLTKIAREHLGQGANSEDIQKHIREIALINHLKNPNLIQDGVKLILPGHTKDGGYVTTDADGGKTTIWPDGRVRQENKDGTGSEVSIRQDGSSELKHWGPQPKDNFEQTTSGDGSYRILDSTGTTVMKPNGDARHENKDGTGYENTIQPDGGSRQKHWGPKPEDNYESTITRDGTTTRVDVDGNRLVTQASGDFRQENKDGTGFERKLQTDGRVTETHWGPTDQDRYVLSRHPDGSWHGFDNARNEHTKWDDGRERISRPAPDSRSCTRIPDGHGGFKELHDGPRPEAKFELVKHADGRTEYSEIGDKPHQPINDANVEAERNRLNELAEKKITDPAELAKFRVDMARFEDRSKQLAENYQKEGLSPAEATKKAHEEIAKTYSQISRVLEANDNPQIPLDGKRRVEIAEQVMSQAATPTSIDQGYHRTCNVTVVEMRTYSRSPSDAAKLVADVVTTGEYVTKNNTKVTLVPGDLAPHDEAKTNPPLDGSRSLASQLFQVTAVNISYQRENSDLRYRQREKVPGSQDTGERLVDYGTKPPQNVEQRPKLSDDQIVNVGNEITGKIEKDWFINHSVYRNENTVKVDSERVLQEKIAEAKAQGKLPVVIAVHTGTEPFLTDSGAGSAGGSGGWHVVTITDYSPGPPAKVAIDNQWGSSSDHSGANMVKVSDLYPTLRDPTNSGNLEEMQKSIEKDRQNGTPDVYKELEFLRLQKQSGNISDEDFREQLARKTDEIMKHVQEQAAAGKLDASEYSKVSAKLFSLSPADTKLQLAQIERSLNLLDESKYDSKVARILVSARLEQQSDVKAGKFDERKKEHYEKTLELFRKVLDDLPPDRAEAIRTNVRTLLAASKSRKSEP